MENRIYDEFGVETFIEYAMNLGRGKLDVNGNKYIIYTDKRGAINAFKNLDIFVFSQIKEKLDVDEYVNELNEELSEGTYLLDASSNMYVQYLGDE